MCEDQAKEQSIEEGGGGLVGVGQPGGIKRAPTSDCTKLSQERASGGNEPLDRLGEASIVGGQPPGEFIDEPGGIGLRSLTSRRIGGIEVREKRFDQPAAILPKCNPIGSGLD